MGPVPNLCQAIEGYLKRLLESTVDGAIEIQRAELANRFSCVPSQINYVLETRFSLERGYLVESRRGGGGFIRIQKLRWDTAAEVVEALEADVGDAVDQSAAEGFVHRLEEAGFVTSREAALIRAAVDRNTLRVDLPWRDVLRANLLKRMVVALLRHAGG